MWEQIGAAAIYGAIGGGLGALIGGLLAAPFRGTKFGTAIASAFAAAGAVLGYNFAEPVLGPYIGEYLPKSSVEAEFDKQLDEALLELKQYPIFDAIIEREPELEYQFKASIRNAVEGAPSSVAANIAAFSESYALLQSRFIYYVARATDEDLITFLTTNVDITGELLVRDPEFCYNMNYNPTALTSMGTIAQLREKLGSAFFDRQQEEGAQLVKNAYDSIPTYDVALAVVGQEAAINELISILGEENLGLITGQRFAANKEEAALACEATLGMFNSIIANEHAATVGRHLFASAQ